MAFTFNGTTKRIYITGVTTVDVADMYSEWKLWAQTSDNFKYLAAFRTFGGDSTVTGQTAPAYFFLINNWRCEIDGIDVVFATNLYTQEGDSPVVTLNGATATIKNSDAPIVTTSGGTANTPQEIADAVWNADYLLYDTDGTMGHLQNYMRHIEKSVWLDTTLVAAGDGTQEAPFNDLTAAIDHAEAENIRDLVLLSDIVLNRNLKNFTIRGIGLPEFDAAGYDLKGCDLNKVKFKGNYLDSVIVQESVLMDGAYLNGYFENCALAGTVRPTATGQALLKNCTSNNTLAIPTLDMTGSTSHVSIQEFTGSLHVTGIDQASAVVHFAGTSANLTTDALCSAGELMANGFTNFTDSTNGTTVIDNTGIAVDTSGMTVSVDYDQIASSVWNKQLAELIVADSTGERLKALLTLNKWIGLK